MCIIRPNYLNFNYISVYKCVFLTLREIWQINRVFMYGHIYFIYFNIETILTMSKMQSSDGVSCSVHVIAFCWRGSCTPILFLKMPYSKHIKQTQTFTEKYWWYIWLCQNMESINQTFCYYHFPFFVQHCFIPEYLLYSPQTNRQILYNKTLLFAFRFTNVLFSYWGRLDK